MRTLRFLLVGALLGILATFLVYVFFRPQRATDPTSVEVLFFFAGLLLPSIAFGYYFPLHDTSAPNTFYQFARLVVRLTPASVAASLIVIGSMVLFAHLALGLPFSEPLLLYAIIPLAIGVSLFIPGILITLLLGRAGETPADVDRLANAGGSPSLFLMAIMASRTAFTKHRWITAGLCVLLAGIAAAWWVYTQVCQPIHPH
jgi:hypothetical protein